MQWLLWIYIDKCPAIEAWNKRIRMEKCFTNILICINSPNNLVDKYEHKKRWVKIILKTNKINWMDSEFKNNDNNLYYRCIFVILNNQLEISIIRIGLGFEFILIFSSSYSISFSLHNFSIAYINYSYQRS